MTQAKIYQALKNCKEPKTSNEIQQITGTNSQSTRHALRKMREHNLLTYTQEPTGHGGHHEYYYMTKEQRRNTAMNETEREMETTKDKVRRVLERYQGARDNDMRLYYLYMRENITGFNATWEDFKNMPNFNTMSRARRKLQENGDYPATTNAQKERDKKEQEVRQWAQQ